MTTPIALEMDRGDTLDINFTFTKAGVAYSLTGAAIKLTAKRNTNDADSAAVFQLAIGSGITVMNAAGGLATARVSPSHTSGIVGESVKLYFDVQIIDSLSAVYTAAKGTLVVLADSTRAIV